MSDGMPIQTRKSPRTLQNLDLGNEATKGRKEDWKEKETEETREEGRKEERRTPVMEA